MVEVRQSRTTEAKLNARLKNSGDPSADHVVKHGEGARRTFHNVHEAGHKIQPGTAAKPTEDGRVASNPGAKSQGSMGVG